MVKTLCFHGGTVLIPGQSKKNLSFFMIFFVFCFFLFLIFFLFFLVA